MLAYLLDGKAAAVDDAVRLCEHSAAFFWKLVIAAMVGASIWPATGGGGASAN